MTLRCQTVFAISLLTLSSAPGDAQQSAARAEVLVLGTYHMANPGRDIFNIDAGDVLAPKRQSEIAQVVAVLKAFQPTKIAVERDPGDKRIVQDYTDYLAGKHDLTRNEVEQIGFRLAREMGHKTLYPVDADGEFPFPRLVKYASATGRSKELDAMMSETGEMVKAQSAFLASHTVLETLLAMNADDKVAAAIGAYFRMAQFGEPWDWAGADLVADWFRRNMRIFTNITRLIEAPNERVLVIYGAGHQGWLQFPLGNSPNIRLRKLAEFAK